MRRYALSMILSALALGLLGVLVYGVSHEGTNSSIDGLVARGHYPPAPDAGQALPVLGSSATATLRDFRGRVVLVNVFASWCTACAQEASVLAAAQRMLARHGGTVLGITYQDNSTDDLAFVRQYHVTYPVLRDVSGNLAHSFGTSQVPESFVIDRAGRIEALRRYQLSGAWVYDTLTRVLSERS